MTDPMLPLPGFSPVSGKSVVAKFGGGLLSSHGGVLVLREVEQRLRVAERLAACLAGPRAPDLITHTLADIIRFRLLMIRAGYVAFGRFGTATNSVLSEAQIQNFCLPYASRRSAQYAKTTGLCHNYLILMASRKGFEPLTYGLGNREKSLTEKDRTGRLIVRYPM